MAAASIDQKSASPKGAQIVALPSLDNTPFALCAATGLPLGPRAVFLDNAQNAFAVASPFVGYMLLKNLSDRRKYDRELGSNAVDRLVPGLGDRQISMMMNTATVKRPEENFNMELLQERAREIQEKTKKKATTVFIEALDHAIESAPFRWKPLKVSEENKPTLPLSEALACGYLWGELTDDLDELFALANEFEKTWGWHCHGISTPISAIVKKRRDRRQNKGTKEKKLCEGCGLSPKKGSCKCGSDDGEEACLDD